MLCNLRPIAARNHDCVSCSEGKVEAGGTEDCRSTRVSDSGVSLAIVLNAYMRALW